VARDEFEQRLAGGPYGCLDAGCQEHVPGVEVAGAEVLPDGQHDRRAIVGDLRAVGRLVLAGAIGGAGGA
jgi:hypothetical protein